MRLLPVAGAAVTTGFVNGVTFRAIIRGGPWLHPWGELRVLALIAFLGLLIVGMLIMVLLPLRHAARAQS